MRTIALTDRQTVDKEPGAFRTISEVADELDVPQHVLRFWETRFSQIKPLKRGGGRRFYRPDDVDLIRGIRHLLYGEGYTIKGVQRILKEEGVRFVQQMGSGEVEAGSAADVSPTDDWQDHGAFPGDNDAPEFPSVVRPLQYSAGNRGDEVVASPPVAAWRGPERAGQRPGHAHHDGGPDVRDEPGQATPQHPGHAEAAYSRTYATSPFDRGAAGDGGRPDDAYAATAALPGENLTAYAPEEWHADAHPSAIRSQDPTTQDPTTQDQTTHDQTTYDQAIHDEAWAGQDAIGASPRFDQRSMEAGAAFVSEQALAPASVIRLAPSQRLRLQEALAELLECRRLLSHARGELDLMD